MNVKQLREVGRRADNVGAVRQVRSIAANREPRDLKDYAFYLALGLLISITLIFLISILKNLLA